MFQMWNWLYVIKLFSSNILPFWKKKQKIQIQINFQMTDVAIDEIDLKINKYKLESQSLLKFKVKKIWF